MIWVARIFSLFHGYKTVCVEAETFKEAVDRAAEFGQVLSCVPDRRKFPRVK